MTITEDRLNLLEKQQAQQTHALKMILEGRWNGEMPHAEADVKMLNPDDTEWAARPFEEGTE